MVNALALASHSIVKEPWIFLTTNLQKKGCVIVSDDLRNIFYDTSFHNHHPPVIGRIKTSLILKSIPIPHMFYKNEGVHSRMIDYHIPP